MPKSHRRRSKKSAIIWSSSALFTITSSANTPTARDRARERLLANNRRLTDGDKCIALAVENQKRPII